MKIKSDKLYSDTKVTEYALIELLKSYKYQLIEGITNSIRMTDFDKVFFFNIFPKLAVHELAENLALQGVRYRLFKLSKKGIKFLAYIDKKTFRSSK